MEFTPCPYKQCNSHFILSSIGIRNLCFWNIRIGTWSFHNMYLDLILAKVGICTLSFQTLNSYLILETLEFWPYPLKLWNKHLFYSKQWNSQLFLTTIGIAPYPFKHSNLHIILSNIGIRTLSFQALDFAPYPSKHWNSHLILSNHGSRTSSFQTLQYGPHPSKS